MKRVVGYSYYAGAIPPQAASSSSVAAPAGPQPSTPKRRRLSAADVAKELTDAKALKDAGLLSSPELRDLKDRLLQGNWMRAPAYPHIRMCPYIIIYTYLCVCAHVHAYVYIVRSVAHPYMHANVDICAYNKICIGVV